MKILCIILQIAYLHWIGKLKLIYFINERFSLNMFSKYFLSTIVVLIFMLVYTVSSEGLAGSASNSGIDWLIIYWLFYVPLKNISLIHVWGRHHYRWRAAKFRPMLDAHGLWAGRDLYRATLSDFSVNMVAFSFYWGKWEHKYTIHTIHLGRDHRPSARNKTFSHTQIVLNRIRTDTDWMWEILRDQCPNPTR
jgi:hypothetical protein